MSAGIRRMRRAGALAILVVGAMVLAGPAQGVGSQGKPLSPALRAIMNKPLYKNATWGLLEVDPATGKVIHSSRADEMFIPGSTAKLFTVSSVWKTVGPDDRISTPVYALGVRHGATFDGNLVLVGSGDLTLGGRTKPDGTVDFTNLDHADADSIPGATLTPEDPLAGIKDLARQVRASGITKVDGDVVVDGRLFESSFEPDPTPLMINDNLIDVLSTPTTQGEPATVTARPASAAYTVDASVKTVAAGQPAAVTISGQAPGRITVTGTVAAGSAPDLKIAPIVDTNSFGRTALIEALQQAGVSIDASLLAANPDALLPATMSYPPSTRVAAFVSPPYREYAKLILKVSLNIGANLGVCLLAVHAGSNDCEAGFAPMKSFLQSAGVDTSQMALADGRGGDSTDRATPVAVTQLLRYWLGQSDFETFLQALPILGVDGSLAGVAADTPAKGNVFAKTGTAAAGDPLNEQIVTQAKALAGYIAKPGGGYMVFDVVVNNAGGGPDIQAIFDVGNDIGQIAALLWQEANPSH